MNSIDKIREIFKKIADLQHEIKVLDSRLYDKFREQNAEISDLEHYNLRRIVKNSDFEPIDTLELRKKFIEKWEKQLEEAKRKAKKIREEDLKR